MTSYTENLVCFSTFSEDEPWTLESYKKQGVTKPGKKSLKVIYHPMMLSKKLNHLV